MSQRGVEFPGNIWRNTRWQNHPHDGSDWFSYLNSVLPLREVDLALALLLGDAGGLVLGETAAQLTGKLGTEVKRNVFLVLVEQTQLGALVGVDDGENTGDRLADVVAIHQERKNSSVLEGPLSMRNFPSVNGCHRVMPAVYIWHFIVCCRLSSLVKHILLVVAARLHNSI